MLLRSWAINSARWPPTSEAGELDPNVDPTVALVSKHALVVGHALFRAQFARELWIEPDDLDDRLAMVTTRLFGGLNQVCGQPRDSGAPGDRQQPAGGHDPPRPSPRPCPPASSSSYRCTPRRDVDERDNRAT
jgi:hypothetical protein